MKLIYGVRKLACAMLELAPAYDRGKRPINLKSEI
jgi:hypothetical protein